MAGIKGRSGPRKGQRNNPNGRTPGALGKAVKEKLEAAGHKTPSNGIALRDRITVYLYEKWPEFAEQLETIDAVEALKIKKDLYKTVLPRPSDPKDVEASKELATSLARFFNLKAEEADK